MRRIVLGNANSLSLLASSGYGGLRYAFKPPINPLAIRDRALVADTLALMTTGQRAPDIVRVHHVFTNYWDAYRAVWEQSEEKEVPDPTGGIVTVINTDPHMEGAIRMVADGLKNDDFAATIVSVLRVFLGDRFSGEGNVQEWDRPQSAHLNRNASDREEILNRSRDLMFHVQNIDRRMTDLKTKKQDQLFDENGWLDIEKFVHLLCDVFALSPLHPLAQIEALRARIEQAHMQGSKLLNAAVKLWEEELLSDMLLQEVGYDSEAELTDAAQKFLNEEWPQMSDFHTEIVKRLWVFGGMKNLNPILWNISLNGIINTVIWNRCSHQIILRWHFTR